MKGRPGGRPRKKIHDPWKARRLARIELALRLRDKGESYEQIAQELNALNDGFPRVTKKTVWNWLNRPCKFPATIPFPKIRNHLKTRAKRQFNTLPAAIETIRHVAPIPTSRNTNGIGRARSRSSGPELVGIKVPPPEQ